MRVKTLLFLLLLVPATGLCAGDPVISFKGRWHVDLDKSVSPFISNTKSVQLDITTDDGEMYEQSETVVRMNGERTTEFVSAPVDGNFHPIKGSPYAASIAIIHRALGSMTVELRMPDGVRGREICTLSADQNAIVCDVSVTGPQGKTMSGKAVYVRD